MKQIVLLEQRPFSYLDFKEFSILNRSYNVAHGTFRNKVSQLMKKGIIELEYNSKVSFYTLAGVHFGNTMTGDHTGNTTVIGVTELVGFIENLSLEDKSIHDIHMKFSVPDIWEILATNEKYSGIINSKSKDIKLQPIYTEDNLKIQTTIHHTDTVSVVVGCSRNPISIEDISGTLRLSNGLVRAEERLSRALDESGKKLPGGYERIPIPGYERWIVTLWHFGKDSKSEYSGDGFSVTFGYARDTLIRIYTKKRNSNRTVIRTEIQQSPNKRLYEAIQEKLI
jgi:hypothetical protein